MSATKIFGLVLAGGKSTRMGKDKGKIIYHDYPQRLHAYNLLNKLCERTYLSVRSDQSSELENAFNVIVDKDNYKGPFNGMMSAHEEYPDVAWLVLATDCPLIKVEHLRFLIQNRNPKKMATAYASNEYKLPEPLIAIWESRALTQAMHFLNTTEGTCPRKFLINNEVELVFPKDDRILMNANTKEEFLQAIEKLS